MAGLARWCGMPEVADANSVANALKLVPQLAGIIAEKALATMLAVLRDAPVRAGVLVVGRDGSVLAEVSAPDDRPGGG